MPRMSKAIVVLQERVVTEALEYGDVVGLFDFVILLLEPRNGNGHVMSMIRHWERVGSGCSTGLSLVL